MEEIKEKSVFEKISDELNERSDRLRKKIFSRFEHKKKENVYWKDLREKAKESREIIKDAKYPCFYEFLSETKKQLENNRNSLLSGQNDGLSMIIKGKDYDRNERLDLASVLTGQIMLLTLIMEYPEKIIENIRSVKWDTKA